MRHSFDEAIKTNVLQFESPIEIADKAREIQGGDCGPTVLRNGKGCERGNWIKSWPQFGETFLKPWAEGAAVVDSMIDDLTHEEVDAPTTRMRKPRWNDDNGEICVDRFLRGHNEMYRDVTRQTRQGPTTISLICQLNSEYDEGSALVFWRGAAAIACMDLLERQGYAVECYIWCASESPYQDGTDSLITCKAKNAGDPVNVSSLCASFSAWFMWLGLYGARAAAAPVSPYLGSPIYSFKDEYMQYLDYDANVPAIHMPYVTTRTQAINAAKKILANVNSLTS